MTTAIQIASRLLILWAVLYMYPAVKVHENFNKMMFVSWCLADITRYLYYLINIFMKPPRLLTILRYNLFLILYPTGITVSNYFSSFIGVFRVKLHLCGTHCPMQRRIHGCNTHCQMLSILVSILISCIVSS